MRGVKCCQVAIVQRQTYSNSNIKAREHELVQLTSLCPDESPDTGGGWSSSASVTGSYSSSSLNGSVSLVSHTISINTLNLSKMSIFLSKFRPHPHSSPFDVLSSPTFDVLCVTTSKDENDKYLLRFSIFFFFLYAFFQFSVLLFLIFYGLFLSLFSFL